MKIFIIILLLITNCSNKNTPISKGNIQEQQMFSQSLNKTITYNVYYPPNYSTNNSYPVVYLLHGLYESHNTWATSGNIQETLDTLISTEKLPPLLAIMPEVGNSWYVDSPLGQMETAFTNDLFPYIESNFNIIKNKNARVVAGISMGGYGALKFGLNNPDYFGSIIALSPAITKIGMPPSTSLQLMLRGDVSRVFGETFSQEQWDKISYVNALSNYLKNRNGIEIFIASGDKDIITPTKDTKNLAMLLLDNNIDYKYTEYTNEHHWWNLWNPALMEGLEYIAPQLTNF